MRLRQRPVCCWSQSLQWLPDPKCPKQGRQDEEDRCWNQRDCHHLLRNWRSTSQALSLRWPEHQCCLHPVVYRQNLPADHPWHQRCIEGPENVAQPLMQNIGARDRRSWNILDRPKRAAIRLGEISDQAIKTTTASSSLSGWEPEKGLRYRKGPEAISRFADTLL